MCDVPWWMNDNCIESSVWVVSAGVNCACSGVAILGISIAEDSNMKR